MRLFLFFVAAALITACDSKPAVTPSPPLNYPFTLVSRSSSEKNGISSTDVEIKVNSALPRDELYLTLLTALEAQHKTPEKVDLYTVKAYADNDLKLKNVVGAVFQSSNGGRVAFKYKDEPTVYSERYASKFPTKERSKPELSSEEKERQREVGKFAGELIEAGRKAQNR